MKFLTFLIVFVGFLELGHARGQRSLTTQEKIERNTSQLRTERNQGKRTNLIKEIEELQAELDHASMERAFDRSLPAKVARTQDDKLCDSLCSMAKNHREYNSRVVRGPMGEEGMKRTIEGMQLNLFEELKDALPCFQRGQQIGESGSPCEHTMRANRPIQNEHRRLTQNVLAILRQMPESDSHLATRNKSGGGNDVLQGEVYQKIHLIMTLEKMLENRPANDRSHQALEKLRRELALDQQQIYSRLSGGWGSLMNIYAVSVALIANDEPFSKKEMEYLANNLESSNASQRLPYNMGRSAPDRSERAASARNTTFYMGLYLHADNGQERFRDRFVESIEIYQKNISSLMGHMLKDGAHTGADQLGSYYFYSTFPYVTSGIKILLEDPRTSREQKRKLLAIQEDLKNQIMRVFNDDTGLFENSGWYSTNGSRTWVNPLLAMGILPLLKNCGVTKVDSYGILPKSMITRSREKPAFCTFNEKVIQLEAGRDCPEGSTLSTFTELEKTWREGHQVMSRAELEQLITPKDNSQTQENMGRHIAAPIPLPAPERAEKECLKLEELLVPGMEVDESTKARLIEFLNQVNGDHCPKY